MKSKRKGKRSASASLVRLIGRVVVGDYPAANYHGIPARHERRRVMVESVRAIEAEPLDPETCRLNPLLQRTATLVTGRDLDRDCERSFYLERFENLRIMPLSRALRIDAAENTACVVCVPRPRGWKPKLPTEVPPGVRVFRVPNPRLAETFAQAYNAGQLRENGPDWSVTLCKTACKKTGTRQKHA